VGQAKQVYAPVSVSELSVLLLDDEAWFAVERWLSRLKLIAFGCVNNGRKLSLLL
jgi:hypothetical protein